MLDPTSGARSLTSLAFEQVRADILSTRLKPGERLRIQALCARYGIGATAIREALSRLVTDGLVKSADQRGFSVAPVSRAELLDLTRTRIEVEKIALGHSVEHGGIEWESNLLSAFHRLSRTPAPLTVELSAPWLSAHRRFHEALIGGSRSPSILQLCRLLYDKLERYRSLSQRQMSIGRGPDASGIDAEHRALLDAALARDLPRASALLAEHFDATARHAARSVFTTEAESHYA